jgi:hypothetical protein
MIFHDLSDGLPAAAEWLHQRGCIDVRYGFQQAGDDR